MKSLFKKSIYFLLLLTLVVCYTHCRKAEHELVTVTHIPDSNSLQEVFIIDSSTWEKDLMLYKLWRLGDLFKNVKGNFDSAYYQDHVQVFVRFKIWTPIPYVASNLTGSGQNAIYFTDDTYLKNVGIGGYITGTQVAPRIIILARPDADIDFTQKVSVQVVIKR
jgi:hypothetical protein